MKKLILLSLVMIASLILVGCGNQKAFAGQASGLGQLQAEACDMDNLCEMDNAAISGIATVGDTLKADTVSARVVRTGEVNTNTLAVDQNARIGGNVEVIGELFIEKLNATRGIIWANRLVTSYLLAHTVRSNILDTNKLTFNGTNDLIDPRSGYLSLMNQSLMVSNYGSSGRHIDLYGKLFVNETIRSNSLIDPSGNPTSIAFACIDGNGKLFRSDVPCR